MACNQVNILNYNHNLVEVTSGDNFLVITDNNACTTITIPQPVTNIIQINTPGPQGTPGPSGDSVFTNLGSGSYSASGSFFITGSLTVSSSNTFTNIGPAIFSGSVNVTNGITGSLQGTASFATTASYVIGGGAGAGFPYSGSAIITGSLLVSGSGLEVIGSLNASNITGSLQGTASWANNAQTASYVQNAQTASYILQAVSASFSSTASYVQNAQTASYILNAVSASFSSTASYVQNAQTASYVQNAQTASYILNAVSASFSSTASYVQNAQTSSYILNAVSASHATNATNANTASFAPNYLSLVGGGTLSGGDITITQNLYVQGTASIDVIQFVSQSSLNIGTNLITVNTSTPATRFGGLAVYDSGSLATGRTGSILWDSQNDVWIYSNPSGALYDGGLLLTGPRNTSGIGNEVGINSWYAAIGNGSHHITSSAIYSSGSLIRLENNTQVTGSLIVSAGITGSLEGTSSWATNALTASYLLGYISSFPFTGSALITGSLTVIGSTAISGSLTVNGVGVAVIKERRQDFVYPFSYCGTAASGSADASAVWTIVRINMSGSSDTIGTATNVAWTNRYSATYI